MRDVSMNTLSAWHAYAQGRGPKPDTPTSLGRHERKCTICEHPDRKAIEQEFLRWYAPQHIAQDHDIPYASAIYRHAHVRQPQRRRENRKPNLERDFHRKRPRLDEIEPSTKIQTCAEPARVGKRENLIEKYEN